MARFDIAIDVVLKHEGGYSNHPSDSGGETMYGIIERIARRYGYDGAMREMPLTFAKDVYREEWWDRYGLGGIRDQDVATKVFDLMVNMGAARPTFSVQEICNACGVPLVEDGKFGPKTRAGVNRVPPAVMVVGLCVSARRIYEGIAKRYPKNQVFLKGWLRRAGWRGSIGPLANAEDFR